MALPGSVEIRTHPLRELGRHVTAMLPFGRLTSKESSLFSVDSVYRSLDRRVAGEVRKRKTLSGVFCSEDGAFETFRAAAEAGKRAIYEMPIGYWRAGRRIQEEEAMRMPEWATTLIGNRDSESKLERKDSELQLASAVLVASSFAQRTLGEAPVPPKKVLVLPYAAMEASVDSDNPEKKETIFESYNGPLRVLFVGSLTQRKGLAYLIEAVERMRGTAELTLVGREVGSGCRPLQRALTRFRWIPSLPRAMILQQMRNHDVLVLPSLFEGFGLVLVEALSQGLPVIASEHTGAPDIIEHGREGFIVPIRSVDAIEDCLGACLRDRSRLLEMRQAALNTAKRLRWENYRRQLAAWVVTIK